jgi:signal transduction histidine kinase
MDRLIRDLLEYSRIMREQLTLQPVSVTEVVKDVLSMNSLPNGSKLKLTIGDNLLPVVAQPTLLCQCLANLLSNAIKFVQDGTAPAVAVFTEPREDRVRIWVEDNGIGIDPAYHHKVFGLFERVGDVSQHEGTGIGLAIVARAVERMGGRCGVESALGSGSRFWIELRSP